MDPFRYPLVPIGTAKKSKYKNTIYEPNMYEKDMNFKTCSFSDEAPYWTIA